MIIITGVLWSLLPWVLLLIRVVALRSAFLAMRPLEHLKRYLDTALAIASIILYVPVMLALSQVYAAFVEDANGVTLASALSGTDEDALQTIWISLSTSSITWQPSATQATSTGAVSAIDGWRLEAIMAAAICAPSTLLVCFGIPYFFYSRAHAHTVTPSRKEHELSIRRMEAEYSMGISNAWADDRGWVVSPFRRHFLHPYTLCNWLLTMSLIIWISTCLAAFPSYQADVLFALFAFWSARHMIWPTFRCASSNLLGYCALIPLATSAFFGVMRAHGMNSELTVDSRLSTTLTNINTAGAILGLAVITYCLLRGGGWPQCLVQDRGHASVLHSMLQLRSMLLEARHIGAGATGHHSLVGYGGKHVQSGSSVYPETEEMRRNAARTGSSGSSSHVGDGADRTSLEGGLVASTSRPTLELVPSAAAPAGVGSPTTTTTAVRGVTASSRAMLDAHPTTTTASTNNGSRRTQANTASLLQTDPLQAWGSPPPHSGSTRLNFDSNGALGSSTRGRGVSGVSSSSALKATPSSSVPAFGPLSPSQAATQQHRRARVDIDTALSNTRNAFLLALADEELHRKSVPGTALLNPHRQRIAKFALAGAASSYQTSAAAAALLNGEGTKGQCIDGDDDDDGSSSLLGSKGRHGQRQGHGDGKGDDDDQPVIPHGITTTELIAFENDWVACLTSMHSIIPHQRSLPLEMVDLRLLTSTLASAEPHLRRAVLCRHVLTLSFAECMDGLCDLLNAAKAVSVANYPPLEQAQVLPWLRQRMDARQRDYALSGPVKGRIIMKLLAYRALLGGRDIPRLYIKGVNDAAFLKPKKKEKKSSKKHEHQKDKGDDEANGTTSGTPGLALSARSLSTWSIPPAATLTPVVVPTHSVGSSGTSGTRRGNFGGTRYLSAVPELPNALSSNTEDQDGDDASPGCNDVAGAASAAAADPSGAHDGADHASDDASSVGSGGSDESDDRALEDARRSADDLLSLLDGPVRRV